MFTSRAEFRILLRQDNADIRLTQKGYDLGLASQNSLDKVNEKLRSVEALENVISTFKIKPAKVNDRLEHLGTATLKEGTSLEKLLKRPELGIEELKQISPDFSDVLETYPEDVIEQTEIKIKYATYIDKESQLAGKLGSMDSKKIPEGFNYNTIAALSAESREKLNKIQPRTLGQASRISGVSPADISVLLVYLNR